MPGPLLLLVPAIGVAARYLLGALAAGVSIEFVQRKARAYFDQYGEQFLASAVADMGLDLSEDGNLTDESITAAINSKLLAGSGVQIDSLLDRDKLRAGLEKLAVQRLAGEIGVPADAVQSVSGIKTALQAWAGEQVAQQLQTESGPVFDAATPSAFIARVIDQAPVPSGNWNAPVDLSAKGVSNRLRQAKYRRSHKRTWVEK